MRIEESNYISGNGKRTKRIQYFYLEPEDTLRSFIDEIMECNACYIPEKERQRVFIKTKVKSAYRRVRKLCITGISKARYKELAGSAKDDLSFVPPYDMAQYIDRDDIACF